MLIIGILMIVALFAAIFIVMGRLCGWWPITAIFLITIGITAGVAIAAWFITLGLAAKGIVIR